MIRWLRRLLGVRNPGVQGHPAPGDLPTVGRIAYRVVAELPERGEYVGEMVVHQGRIRVWLGDRWSRGVPHGR